MAGTLEGAEGPPSPLVIIGGKEAQPHSRPYMAFVDIDTGRGVGNCGGFLIQPDVVVTAAHCNCNLGNITVLLGAHNVEIQEPDRQAIHVRRRIPHPKYNDETNENDIMLLQLKHKARLTKAVDTIPLSKREMKKGTVCRVAGWGLTSNEATAKPSPTLQEVELKIMDKSLCLHYLHYVPSLMLCVGDPDVRRASFWGDSGGPLVCDGKVQGIVSYGRRDGLPPRVFTNVSKYISWIKKILRKLKP
uniref:Peptidase S1 domain-containing protein n=1 Tax=Pelusios castaneus TaxID=367368 RepID=A0A8C8RK56_9SAUR